MVQQRRDSEQRPSPEALLEAARREESRAGKLKIFVGAAPGVGKTYEMLQSAHARIKAGARVRVGRGPSPRRAGAETLLARPDVRARQRPNPPEHTPQGMGIAGLLARRPS